MRTDGLINSTIRRPIIIDPVSGSVVTEDNKYQCKTSTGNVRVEYIAGYVLILSSNGELIVTSLASI